MKLTSLWSVWDVKVPWRQYRTTDLPFVNPPVSLQALFRLILGKRSRGSLNEMKHLSLLIQYVYTGLEVPGCPALICSLKVWSNSVEFCVYHQLCSFVYMHRLHRSHFQSKHLSLWLTWKSVVKICKEQSSPYSWSPGFIWNSRQHL